MTRDWIIVRAISGETGDCLGALVMPCDSVAAALHGAQYLWREIMPETAYYEARIASPTERHCMTRR
jgi:hypothetical protein